MQELPQIKLIYRLMAKKNIHIVPYKQGWAVRREGSKRVTSIHSTQKDAIASGRVSAKNNKVELVTHGQDGKIRDKDSYGHDPNPPKDTTF